MLKFIGTDVIVSKGFGDKPARRFSEEGKSVQFRIGKRVYDPRAENKQRWLNINVKAFGELCERIRKMKLDADSFVHIEGRYDEDTWQGEDGKIMRAPCIILADIEYAYSGNGGNKENSAAGATSPTATSDPQDPPHDESTAEDPSRMPGSFSGYEHFGEENPFFPKEGKNPFTTTEE